MFGWQMNVIIFFVIFNAFAFTIFIIIERGNNINDKGILFLSLCNNVNEWYCVWRLKQYFVQ